MIVELCEMCEDEIKCVTVYVYFQNVELQSEIEHLKAELTSARSQYKDAAQEVHTLLILSSSFEKGYLLVFLYLSYNSM